MGEFLSIQIDTSDVDKALSTLGTPLSKALIRKFENHGRRVVSRARRLVPVLSGDLQASIGFKVIDDFALEIFAAEDYADLVEFGTSFMDAQPYLNPSVDELQPALVDNLQKVLDEAASRFSR